MRYSPLLCAFLTSCLWMSAAQAQETPVRQDLMTFATGVLPYSVTTGPGDLRTDAAQAISMIDGNPVRYLLTPKPAGETDSVEIIFALPALTRFDRFAVPNIGETPSPSQTFIKFLEVSGAVATPEGPFVPLARMELSTHDADDSVTELAMAADQPEVRFVKVRFVGGIDVQTDTFFLEFSELIGNGTQRAPAMSEGFAGAWKGRGVKIELAQDGPSVTGCYDGESKLAGTVEGNVLRALGQNDAGIPSQFILIAAIDGSLRGLRSTNGAPFKPYDGVDAVAATACLAPEPPKLGCGSTLHGIGFDFDSDVIRPESEPLLDKLFAGLAQDEASAVQIVGHSSSEGDAEYNRALSERRANAVVNALIQRGLDGSSITAAGRGEDEPIASNADEAGRSLNRRVEIKCGT